MQIKKLIALLLTLVSVFSCMSFSAAAVGTEAELEELEALATAYVQDYVDTIYFYESPDLAAGTLKEVYSVTENLSATQMSATLNSQTVELCGVEQSAAELCENLSVAETFAEYMKYIRSEQDIVRNNFNMDVSVVDTCIAGDSAYVHLYTHITFYYENDPEMAEMGDNYVIYFAKLGGDWIIADVEVEEIEACGYGEILTTVDAKLETFDAWLAAETLAEGSISANANVQSMEETVQPMVVDTTYHRAYNRSNAVAYAYTYTTSSYTGSGNDPAYMNSIFPNYTSSGGNCMNFASQCLWAGFKGNDTASALTNQELPMHVASNGWYYTSSGNRSSSWTATEYFKTYVNSISSSSSAGMMTTRYTISAGTSFAAAGLSYLPGSVILVNSNSHAAVISSASSTAYSGIKICENSPMRKAVNLTDRGYHSGSIYLIVPNYVIEPASCGSYSAHNFQTGYAGCTRCDYTKLRVTGTMYQPVSVNTTLTITGNANMNCYRMAIGITTPSNVTTWYELEDTASISKAYKFTETGLYTITISARDVTDNDALSTTDTHIFKIRIY